MQWRLILEEYMHNIQNIDVVDNVVVDTLSFPTSANMYQYESSTMSDSRRSNELFIFDNDEDAEVNFPLAPPLVQRRHQEDLNQSNSKLKVDLTK